MSRLAVAGRLAQSPERDLGFTARKTLSAYADDAVRAGSVRAQTWRDLPEARGPAFDERLFSRASMTLLADRTGISGSPVYNQTAQALSGMVMRGGMTGSRCTIYYLDVRDIVHFLDALSRGATSAYYTKPG
jgi:hypothetical protein